MFFKDKFSKTIKLNQNELLPQLMQKELGNNEG